MTHEDFVEYINKIADFMDASDEETAKIVVSEMNTKIKVTQLIK